MQVVIVGVVNKHATQRSLAVASLLIIDHQLSYKYNYYFLALSNIQLELIATGEGIINET